jgi:osmoprotectant transport system ATP-binding protein
MVNRLYEPTSGHIYLNGLDIRQVPATTLRRQIGYVIQQGGLFPHMTVAQNVAVVPKLLGWSKRRSHTRVQELLELVELPPKQYGDRYPGQLSGGQQQRVGLARALAGDPQVILMDEPFGALDAITRTSLQDEIVRLQQQVRKTILFVSHDVEEALRLADRILILKDGAIVQYDTPFNILVNPVNAFVRELMGSDDVVRRLSVLAAGTIMQSLPHSATKLGESGEPSAIAPQTSLRQALSLLLQPGITELTVIDQGRSIGIVNLDHIHQAVSQSHNGRSPQAE